MKNPTNSDSKPTNLRQFEQQLLPNTIRPTQTSAVKRTINIHSLTMLFALE